MNNLHRIRLAACAAVGVTALTAAGALASPEAAPPRAPSPAATHEELMAPYLNGPAKVRETSIDLRKDRILVVALGRDIDTTAVVVPEEATFDDKVALLANRNIPLTGINVYDWTSETTSPRVSNNVYATFPQLRSLTAAGGAITSEGRAHTFLTGMTRWQQWSDTCGVLDDYRAKGLEASGMYAYSGGPYQSAYQSSLVKYCYAFGRKYGRTLNRMTALADPWVLNVRSVNGGCVTARATCFGSVGKRSYDTDLATTLVPRAGQVAVLQVYHLYVGSGPTWDCDSARHQTYKSETYCLNDVTDFLDNLPADVKVATIDDLARAVGRAPEQLPGLAFADYLAAR